MKNLHHDFSRFNVNPDCLNNCNIRENLKILLVIKIKTDVSISLIVTLFALVLRIITFFEIQSATRNVLGIQE